MNKHEYLKKHIYHGLENLNDGFDAQSIYYFSKEDFEVVLKRCEQFNVGIMGIEVWPNKTFHDVATFEMFNTTANDPTWYWQAYRDFIEDGVDSYFSASYEFKNESMH